MADAETRSEVVQGPTPARPDRGFTLVELVVTITLMAIVIVPILSAVATSIKSSSLSRSASQVETTLVNAADRVNRAPKKCDYDVFIRAAAKSQGWNGDRATAVYEHYVPPAQMDQQGQWVAGGCLLLVPTDLLVQRVTITIASPDNQVRRTIQVVKSDV